MKNKTNRNTRTKLFLVYLLSFSFIFVTLGLIVYNSFNDALTINVDTSIKKQIKRIKYSKYDIISTLDDSPLLKQAPDFKVYQILWSKDGEITNKNAMGTRYPVFSKITFNKSDLNKFKTIKQKKGPTFRSYLMKIPDSAVTKWHKAQYIQIIENIEINQNSLTSFRNILLVSLLIFGMLSIALSFMLSSISIKPMISAWNKQREFIDNAAHELRTPLTIIQNKLEYLLTKPNAKIIDESESIATSLSEIRRLNNLTKDLLLLANSDSNANVLHFKKVPARAYFEDIIQPYADIALSQDKKFNFQIKISNQYIYLDEDRIHQLIVILLDNALKYTVACNEIAFIVVDSNKQLVIQVINDGENISDAHKKIIFQRFYREEKSRNRKTGGNGLGLSIAKWIVDEHKGKIEVMNKIPKGVIFEVTLPMKLNE
ncbi:sensor histidine kinase [Dellaglioa sp. BT-FLS60]